MQTSHFFPAWARGVAAGVAIALLTACGAEVTPRYGFRVVNAYPHDTTAYTQGLIWVDGQLYESTGKYGASTVRRVEPGTGAVLESVDLPDDMFGEGMTIWKGNLVVLTWQSGQGLVLARDGLSTVRTFTYPGEGWGLTHSQDELIMSDGTAQLRFLDGDTFAERRRLTVTHDGQPVEKLNELEWVRGEIWANIYQSNLIARIDPGSGVVVGWIDLTGLLQQGGVPAPEADVLNGIAWDAASGRIFVTGKYWPRLFEIEVVEPG